MLHRTGNCKVVVFVLTIARIGWFSVELGVAGQKRAVQESAADESLLTVERIYASGEFAARSFSARWAHDGRGYTVLEPSKSGGRDIVLYEPATGKPEVLVPAAWLVPPGSLSPLDIQDYAFAQDWSKLLIYTNSKRVWRMNTRGDYWVLDRTSRQLWKLGGPGAMPASLMFAKFSPDGRFVAYVRERSIYVEDLEDRSIRVVAQASSEDIINGTFDWVYEEELGLRDGFRWSSDSKRIAYWQLDTSGVPRFPLVNNTDSFYPRIKWIPYPKVGQRNSACRVGVVELAGGKTVWMKVPGDARNHYIARMDWADNSQQLLIQQLDRRQKNNRLMLADAATGRVDTILTESDEAWVDVHDELFWLERGKRFTWISERDGWRHLYLGSRSDGQLQRVTAGPYDVIRLLRVDEAAGVAYFIASPDNPTQRYLYRIRLDGSDLKRLSPASQPGTHSYKISPDAKWAFHTYSRLGTPPAVELISLPEHKQVRELVTNEKLREKLARLKQGGHEFFRVAIGDGVKLDGWGIKPPKFEAKKKYPVIVYVYGEPAGQTVLDRWFGSNYLWHLMLAQHGYFLVSFDNRGVPAPRGRQWRKCVYRKLGILGPADQAAALQALLKQRPCLDASRVGIWGWSGGGTSTLHAMFKYPKLYKTGIAIAPVPHERYYDTIYQERYMDLPGNNPEGYIKGSALNFAHQLQGNLLIIHGTGDDNCHYATTEMLINELIRHHKQLSLMIYPNRSHSIHEGRNTTRHLRSLMLRFFLAHLPPGPK